ncbi:hypothetical protein Tco_0660967 [Tanacetum coccineum]
MGGMGREPQKGPTEPAPQTQTTPSATFVMKNIDMLRTTIKEYDQQVKAKATPKKLICGDSDEDALDTSLPRHTTASVMWVTPSYAVTQQEGYDRKSGLGKRGNVIGRKKKCKSRNANELDRTRMMVDYTIMLEALVEGFQVRRIYVDGGSSSEVITGQTPDSHDGIRSCQKLLSVQRHIGKDRHEKLRSRSIHHPLNDKVPYGQWNCNNDNQERNPTRVPNDGRGPSPGEKNYPPLNTSLGIRRSTCKRKGGSLRTPVTIRGNLTTECRADLIGTLRKHADAFAWTLTDMTGIPCSITKHELKTHPHIEPRVQRKRSIAPNRRKVVKEEVAEWLKAGIVKRVGYPTWVANPVLVKRPEEI